MRRALAAALLVLVLVSSCRAGFVHVVAASESLPTDATPLQTAIYQALKASQEANEPVPQAEYFSYGNGTTLTTLTYENGTQRQFRETFKIKEATVGINPSDPLFLGIETTSEEATDYVTKVQDILLGFTFQIPKYEWSFEIPLVAEGGISIDIGFGLRLPVQLTLEYPEIMATNSIYTLYSTIQGLDWSSSDYADVGLPPDGNEFLCRFMTKAWLTVLGSTVFFFDISFDESRSFTTPIGPGDTFPLPTLPVPLNPIVEAIVGFDLDPYVILTLEICPSLGSDRVTADWKAENGVVGSGSLLWTYGGEKLSFDIGTQDIIAVAEVTLSNFRYWFTIFLIDFYLHVNFQGILDPLGEAEILLYTLDLSAIIGSMDLFVGVHKYTIGTVIVTIFVVPEFPLGTLTALAGSLAGLVLYKKLRGAV